MEGKEGRYGEPFVPKIKIASVNLNRKCWQPFVGEKYFSCFAEMVNR